MPEIELVTRSSFTNMDWWGVLTASEQRTVLIETQALTEEMVKYGMSRLAIGERLLNLRDILEPKRKFVNFLNTQCRFSRATAYRYINTYLSIKDRVPEVVLRTAIARGFDITDAALVEKMPPPKTHDRKKIVRYLEKIEECRREERSMAAEPEYDPDLLMREALNFVSMRFGRLPLNKQARGEWLEQLVGMLLSDLGMREEQSFVPIPVPEAFRVVRSRPKAKSAA